MKQLTLADVEKGQYFRTERYGPCQVYYIGPAGNGDPICRFRSLENGIAYHISQAKSKELPVELMELVPKDRDSDLLKALEAVQQWEAYLLMADGAWENGLPVFTQELYDKWMEIQPMRNAAIAKAKGETS